MRINIEVNLTERQAALLLRTKDQTIPVDTLSVWTAKELLNRGLIDDQGKLTSLGTGVHAELIAMNGRVSQL